MPRRASGVLCRLEESGTQEEKDPGSFDSSTYPGFVSKLPAPQRERGQRGGDSYPRKGVDRSIEMMRGVP